MSLRIDYSQTSVSAQFQFAGAGQAATPTPAQPRHEHHRERVNSEDQVTLSSEAKQTHKVRHEHDDDGGNSMSALDKLVSKIVRTMLKAMVGEGFNLLEPGQQAPSGTPAAQVPAPAVPATTATSTPATTAPPVATGTTTGTNNPSGSGNTVPATTGTGTTPDTSANPPAGPFSNAVAAYYQVQSFNFDFSGSVNTEDGQQMGISVHFSFSQQFAAVVGSAANGGANTPVPPTPDTAARNGTAKPSVAEQFQGVAAQLTQSNFSFEVDLNGQPDNGNAPSTPNPTPGGNATAAPTATTTSAPVTGTTPTVVTNGTAPTDTTGTDLAASLFDQLDKLFERMQIWLRHPEGGRQLVAVGINRTTAMYVGNLSAPAEQQQNAQQVTQPAATTGTAADTEKTQAVNVVA